MKIVFIGGRDIHKLGGIENYMYNLATELVKIGHEPIVFCESDHNGEETVNGFRVIHQKSLKSRYLCKPWLNIKATLYTIFKIKKVDFIHYNCVGILKGATLARLFGIHQLKQGHGFEWERPKYTKFQQKILKADNIWGVRHSQHLIMCSDVQTKFYHEQFDLNPITIPTAINIPLEDAPESDVLNKFGLVRGKYFLYLARLVQDKNPDYLIRAFNIAKPKGYKLVIAGNNPAAPDYVKMLHHLGANNPDVIFTDAVYDADKDCLLRNAFAFCIPSTIEGLSISLLEAMSYRLPIIASDIPSNREVLDTDKALWVKAESTKDLTQAILQSITDTTFFCKSIHDNYNKVINNYTWVKVAEKYITALQYFTNNDN